MSKLLVIAGCVALATVGAPSVNAESSVSAVSESHHRHHHQVNPVYHAAPRQASASSTSNIMKKIQRLVEKIEKQVEAVEQQREEETETEEQTEEPMTEDNNKETEQSSETVTDDEDHQIDGAANADANGGSYRITVHNNCGRTIWPAAFQHNFGGVANFPTLPASSTGTQLNHGQSWTINPSQNWIGGRIWARLNNPGNVQVHDYDWTGALTLAEFGYGWGGNTFFDISQVQGFNVGVRIVPTKGSCGTVTCGSNSCPTNQAYKVPSDDQATRACPAGQSDFDVTFCP